MHIFLAMEVLQHPKQRPIGNLGIFEQSHEKELCVYLTMLAMEVQVEQLNRPAMRMRTHGCAAACRHLLHREVSPAQRATVKRSGSSDEKSMSETTKGIVAPVSFVNI